MNAFSLLWNYLRWHYGAAYRDMFFIAKNYLWGVAHLFSVSTLLRTLFVPWRRMSSHTAKFFQHPFDFLGDMLINVTMRLFGFFVRVLILLLSLIVSFVVVGVFVVVFVSWTMLPLALISILIQAISLLFL
ncbi:MAG TPA: hypothetical protein VJ579_00785 [Candidatus Paceibacterota bacterium]|nr:hypothetical protein [Candidatus Paceibacterota bacterium]